jgi:hypothetical protein
LTSGIFHRALLQSPNVDISCFDAWGGCPRAFHHVLAYRHFATQSLVVCPPLFEKCFNFNDPLDCIHGRFSEPAYVLVHELTHLFAISCPRFSKSSLMVQAKGQFCFSATLTSDSRRCIHTGRWHRNTGLRTFVCKRTRSYRFRRCFGKRGQLSILCGRANRRSGPHRPGQRRRHYQSDNPCAVPFQSA